MLVLPKGIRHIPGYLDRERQEMLVEAIRRVVAEAPLFTPVMPRTGKEMSVRMTNCGPLGWAGPLDALDAAMEEIGCDEPVLIGVGSVFARALDVAANGALAPDRRTA